MTEELWYATLLDHFQRQEVGYCVQSVRRAHGKRMPARDAPKYVKEYLFLKEEPLPHSPEIPSVEFLRGCLAQGTLTSLTERGGKIVIGFHCDPPRQARHKKERPGKNKINNWQDLLDFWYAENWWMLQKHVFKYTDCGASISVVTPEGKWYHCGGDWSGVTEISGFTIQTIVEGSEATVDSDVFWVPVKKEEVENWIKDMEAEADSLWHEANDPPEKVGENWYCACGGRLVPKEDTDYLVCNGCGTAWSREDLEGLVEDDDSAYGEIE